MTILIDTREQKPIRFGNLHFSERKTLNVGDYTSYKLHKYFHIERKSPGDLYGSIIQGHMRFRRMLQRALDSGTTIVIFVECTQHVFESMLWPRAKERKTKPETLKKIIATMKRHYDLEFVWCKNRKEMKEKILSRLSKEERRLKKICSQ